MYIALTKAYASETIKVYSERQPFLIEPLIKQYEEQTGNISIQKVLNIVETVEDPSREITLKDANSINKDKSEIYYKKSPQ